MIEELLASSSVSVHSGRNWQFHTEDALSAVFVSIRSKLLVVHGMSLGLVTLLKLLPDQGVQTRCKVTGVSDSVINVD